MTSIEAPDTSIEVPDMRTAKEISTQNLFKKIKTNISKSAAAGYFTINMYKYIFDEPFVTIIMDYFTKEGYDILESDDKTCFVISWDKSESSYPDVDLNIKISLEVCINQIKLNILNAINKGEFSTSSGKCPSNKILFDKIYKYYTDKGYTLKTQEVLGSDPPYNVVHIHWDS